MIVSGKLSRVEWWGKSGLCRALLLLLPKGILSPGGLAWKGVVDRST
jgi:hypothetical protein